MSEIRHPLTGENLVEIINPNTGKPWVIDDHDSGESYRKTLLVPEDTFTTLEGAEPANPPRFHGERKPPGQ